mmetsp:Transcript_32146/g.68011  ORF Transcript_32146/g.68011 Transcript_32146/m.68011 type:complete len:1341 (-) Transcript_32146:252-4274(-)|eukprot:CAMPEP_0183747626 /NCGR_PEP_ID=MMETSP0737-20130205/67358_1 /TAXON_ID=385413 /ORGANISM="Thalassiosira miniscula, Strain CCMP1093" /LENGTH=1340 /DNA_ID=CAMNT_0025983339 /DNA_START=194 /DNA_END=4216 /DNA_ORIENTATION=+
MSTATSKATAAAAADVTAAADGANNNSNNNNNKAKKKKKIRPKLKPISSMEENLAPSPENVGALMGFGNFVPTNSSSSRHLPRDGMEQQSDIMMAPTTTATATDTVGRVVAQEEVSVVAVAAATPPKTKIKQQRPSAKIQPRNPSSPYPQGQGSPRTPDADHYDDFGFDLVMNSATPKEAAAAPKTKNDNIKNASSSSLSAAAAGGGKKDPTKRHPPSPFLLRRVQSSDSYISPSDDEEDESSSSEEDVLYHHSQHQRDSLNDDRTEHVFVTERRRNEDHGRNNNNNEQPQPHFAPRRTSLIGNGNNQSTPDRSLISSSTADATTGSDAQDLIHPYQGRGVRNANSFSSSSSSFASSSDGALPQSYHHENNPTSSPISANLSQTFPKYNPQTDAALRGQSPPVTPPLLMRSYSVPQPPVPEGIMTQQLAIELKLSLSEEDDASSGRRFRSPGKEERTANDPPHRPTSTPSHESLSSADDPLIANELSVYAMSNTLRRKPSLESAASAGRHPPADDTATSTEGEAPTPVQSFYTSPQSAMLAATAQSQSSVKPRAATALHHDSSFLTNLRDGWMGGSVASVASATSEAEAEAEAEDTRSFGSPGGAFGEPGSPPDLSAKSSPRTPHSLAQSLAYSDEEENHNDRAYHRRRRRLTSCLDRGDGAKHRPGEAKFRLYSSRWMMLLYVSLLDLVSGWTCYTIAPVSTLTGDALGMEPENLVALFFAANVLATTCVPVVLSWIGLRRTVLLGALLLMIGNIVRSGNGLLGSTSDIDRLDDWRLYSGFLLAGLSQPLYQCTQSYVVLAWFPPLEKSFATGVALHSNRIGIGCAFVFGTLLVETSDDLIAYFHLLSVLSAVLFVAVAMQFDDAPPTPPSETARLIRGTLEKPITFARAPQGARPKPNDRTSGRMYSPKARRARPPSNKERKYLHGSADSESLRLPLLPSNASFGSLDGTQADSSVGASLDLIMEHIDTNDDAVAQVPALVIQGPAAKVSYGSTDISFAGVKQTLSEQTEDSSPASPFPNLRGDAARDGGGMLFQQGLEYNNFSQQLQAKHQLPPTEDDGAEPIIVQTSRHFDIFVRGDQIWCSLRACFARKGFSHCALAFATAGLTTNALSTFMDDLVTLDGSGQDSVGTVGGIFHLLIMVSSSLSGKRTDKADKHFIIIIALLALGALALELCSTNLDSGESFRSNLLVVALFLGPLQTLSTELGVEVVHPLSENIVFTNQQLFSNFLTAACIPLFKALRDISISLPFTYSLHLLLIMHALSTIYVATFDAENLRNKVEEREKKKLREQTKTPDQEISGSLLLPKPKRKQQPKPPIHRDKSWGKKYPFLIPSSSSM